MIVVHSMLAQINKESDYTGLDSLFVSVMKGETDGSDSLFSSLDKLNQLSSGKEPPFRYMRGLINKAFLSGRHLLAKSLIDWIFQSWSGKLTTKDKFELYAFYIDIYTSEESLDSLRAILQDMEVLARQDIALDDWRPQLLLARGIVASKEERFFDALKNLSDIKFHHGEKVEDALLVMVNAQQGVIFIKLQRYDFALPLLKEARHLAGEPDLLNPVFAQSLYNNLGIAYMRQDSFKQAVGCFTFLMENLGVSGNPVLMSQLYHNLATTRRLEGQFSKALSLSDSTISLCSKFGFPVGVIFGRLGKAETYLEMNEGKKALEELEKSKSLLAQYPIPDLHNEWSRLAARAFQFIGKYEEAYRELETVYEIEEDAREEQIDQLINAWEVQLKNNQSEQRALKAELQLAGEQLTVRQLIFGSILLVMIIIGGILYLMKRRQREEVLARLVEKEKENTKLQLEIKNRELASKSLDIQKALGIREVMVKKLKSLDAKTLEEMNGKIKILIGELKSTLPQGLWEDFKKRFENVERDFIPKLLEVCPDLSPIELKTATFLRLNLTSKEIASLTNRAIGTVNNNRSSLRKKLDIDNDENLLTFLLSL